MLQNAPALIRKFSKSINMLTYWNQTGYECFALSMVEYLSMVDISVALGKTPYFVLVLACACVSNQCGAQALRDSMIVI